MPGHCVARGPIEWMAEDSSALVNCKKHGKCDDDGWKGRTARSTGSLEKEAGQMRMQI